MKTETEIESFRAQLTQAKLSLSSPRAHTALNNFKDGKPADECIENAVRLETIARDTWIATALDPWCKRHGITRKQGLSIASRDDTYDHSNPSKPLVTLKDLSAWGGQQNDFFSYLNAEVDQNALAAPAPTRHGFDEREVLRPKLVISVKNGVVQYASSNIPLDFIVHDEDALSEKLDGEEQTELLDRVAAGCTQIAVLDSATFVDQGLAEQKVANQEGEFSSDAAAPAMG